MNSKLDKLILICHCFTFCCNSFQLKFLLFCVPLLLYLAILPATNHYNPLTNEIRHLFAVCSSLKLSTVSHCKLENLIIKFNVYTIVVPSTYIPPKILYTGLSNEACCGCLPKKRLG